MKAVFRSVRMTSTLMLVLIGLISYHSALAQSKDLQSQFEVLQNKFKKHIKNSDLDVLPSLCESIDSIAQKLNTTSAILQGFICRSFTQSVSQQFNEAILIAENGLTYARSHQDTLHRSYSDLHNFLAHAYQGIKKHEVALRLYEHSAVLDSLIELKTDTIHFTHLQNLTQAYINIGKYDKALQFAQSGVTGTEKYLGIQYEDYIPRLQALSLCYRRTGDIQKALDVLLQCVEVGLKIKGPEHKHLGSVYNALTGIYLRMEQLDKAKEAIEKSLHNLELNEGKGSFNYYSRKMKLGNIFRSQDNYPEAMRIYFEIYDHYYSIGDTINSNFSITASSIGLAYNHLGQPNRGRYFQNQAKECTSLEFGVNHLYTSMELNNLARIEMDAGAFETAAKYYTQAIAIEFENRGTNHWRYGLYHYNLANAYLALDSLEKAEYHSNISKENTLQELGEGNSFYASNLEFEAKVAMHNKAYQRSILLLHQANQVYVNNFGKDHSESLNIHSGIAMAYELNHQLDSAAVHYQKFKSILQAQIQNNYPKLDEKSRIAFWNSMEPKIQNYFAFMLTRPNATTQDILGAYELHTQVKGASLVLHINQNAFFKNESEAQTLQDSLRVKKELLAEKLSENKSNTFSAVNREIEELESRLALLYKAPQTIANQNLNFKNQQEILDQEEVFVDIIYLNRSSSFLKDTINSYYAFMIQKDHFLRCIPLANKDAFNKKIDYASVSSEALKVKMDKLIVDDIKKHLSDQHTIIISPAEDYHFLPYNSYSALTDGKSSLSLHVSDRLKYYKSQQALSNYDIQIFAAPDYDITLEDWNEKILNIESTQDSTFEALAFGLRSETTDTRNANYFNTLAGTEIEARQIDAHFKNKGFQSTMYLKSNALEDQFLSLDGASSEIIHVATHGFAFGKPKIKNIVGRNMRERLILSDNPMLRSGLALTGANRSWLQNTHPKYMEDGILTAFEIADLDLSESKLVVLSACESGLGDQSSNEGVFGMSRAFKIAGVDKLLLSLWKIPDAETAELMDLFYENLISGKTPFKSLEQAQKTMAKKYSPFYWAGFLLVE